MEACCSRFTAAEGGARLAAAAHARNTLAVEYASFIATRLIHENAYKIRGPLSAGKQRSVYVTRETRVPVVAYELTILTDLAVAKDGDLDWRQELEEKEVLVCTSPVLQRILEDGVLEMSQVNVLIIDSCHLVCKDPSLKYIMQQYKNCEEPNRPRILALTYPLFASTKKDTTDNKIQKPDNTDEQKDSTPSDDSEENNINTDVIDTKDSDTEKNAIDKEKDKKNEIEELGVYENCDDFEMYEKLEWKIEQMEQELCCHMDLAEDIDGGKRLSATLTKPNELIIEYGERPSTEQLPTDYIELERYMRDTVDDVVKFIDEHRYDPTEIYGEDMYEEFMNIPDPTIVPKQIIKQFLYVLEQLGPYAADKAAFSLLTKLEKLKIKEPYERHFLLLCLCTTMFVKIRCFADDMFSKYEDWLKIKTFSTPKVLRFAEILEKFQPPENKESKNDKSTNCTDDLKDNSKDSGNVDTKEKDSVIPKDGDTVNQVNDATTKVNENDLTTKDDESTKDSKLSNTNKLLQSIENCDFLTLSNKIEDRINTYQSNLKDIDVNDLNKSNIVIHDSIKTDKDVKDGIKADDTNTKNGTVNDKIKTDKNDVKDIKADATNTNNDKDIKDNATDKDDVKDIKADDTNKNDKDIKEVKDMKNILGFSRKSGHRARGRGRVQRSNAGRVQQTQQNPDALCGIVFMKEALMAKIMFMVIVDMSRCNAKLGYLCAQYCAVETPDPEPRECRRQGKKQEDVLKKFRMHECNLLLATSALEEGIDLPRCNLVLRWDFPASYRSYGLCRGRARAARASSALLCATDQANTLLDNVAVYKELDQIISRKCGCGVQDEPPQTEEDHADSFTLLVQPYTPETKNDETNDRSHRQNDKDISDVSSIDNREIDERGDNSKDSVDGKLSTDNTINSLVKEKRDDIDNKTHNVDISKSTTDNIDSVDVKPSIDNKNSEIDDKGDATESKVPNNVNDSCNKCNKIREDSKECVCVQKEVKVKGKNEDIASVDLSTAIALINRYCGKLPSDTFTRLAPQWWMEEVMLPVGESEKKKAYICTLRLPLNCPVKYNIVGHPMPTRVLARRMVALQACRILHMSGELDHQLLPIGKENFKAAELDAGACAEPADAGDARPGTTKRRQYYYKRTAWAFTDCQPVIDTSDSEIDPPGAKTAEAPPETEEVNKGTKRNMLYAIVSSLWCALPERYNTRGRRLHAPQHASQAIGILMARNKPDNLQIPSFPVYTRSGEVRVRVEHVPGADARLSPRRARRVRRFMRFVFASVLRVRRRGMRLAPDAHAANDYYIVPTTKTIGPDGSTKIDIDWAFLELIYQHTEKQKHPEVEKPIQWYQDDEDEGIVDSNAEPKDKEDKKRMESPLLRPGETFVFDAERYREAVVTPWYRNQDQPQFFLVAEICWNLSPDSAFPSASHTSFRDYYSSKYGVTLTQPNQPLLDVDHTSARLNLLTPRYVNRKGVALPVSSERTRRAKRDRLDQKQILVPELCRVHPFAAPLWFATVALPCVLYRINALLIADEIRRAVAIDVGLGVPKIDERSGFQWPPLDFGWSLAEVLSADSEKNEKKKEEDDAHKDKELTEKERKEEEKECEEEKDGEPREKTLNDIMQNEVESGFEIGTWSNDMASSIPQTDEYDEYMEPLPSNLTFCTSASGGTNWCDPIEKPKSQFNPSKSYAMADSDCSYMSSDFDTDDSDLNSEVSDETGDTGFCSSRNSNAAMGVRIEYKTAHEAEAVDLERKKKVNPAPQADEEDDTLDRACHQEFIRSGVAPEHYVEKFRQSVNEHKQEIIEKGNLIHQTDPIVEILPEPTTEKLPKTDLEDISTTLSKVDVNEKSPIKEIFPYGNNNFKLLENGQINLETIEKNKRVLLAELKKSLSEEEIKKMNCFSMVDVDIDSPNYVNEKVVNVGFDTKEAYVDKINNWVDAKEFKPYYQDSKGQKEFDFDYQPDLEGHPGPSPSVILQALTMSNANDGINLERLETIGDSFLKFAITAYLYCAHPTVHEGKLSHMRSKQVSNLNLYRLGRNKRLGARMIASKFEPHDNWLPPCHRPPATLQPAPGEQNEPGQSQEGPLDSGGCFIPYNLITQHSIPDKSIADCVEALIGAYLLECGPRGALLFMSWLGIRVLPRHLVTLPADRAPDQKPQSPPSPKRDARDVIDSDTDDSSDDEEEPWQQQEESSEEADWSWPGRTVGSLRPYKNANGEWVQPVFGELKAPPSPLIRYVADPEGELEQMLSGYDALERTLQYRFKDRSLLLQALTHASHQQNRLTDCYQRLEFLGDAILDYLITRHLYEEPRRHSPGALTDLRSALVNNTIFATLAARHGFHKYFRHLSPGLNEVLTKYVKIQEENGHSISEEHYLIQEDEMEQAEDVEVPKALGDLFESVAGAIFLDSGMSLGAVWRSYVRLMGAELEAFSAAAPKSPVRELLEAEPDTAKFGKPERLADGRRVRVCVEVFGRGAFKGIGRNYRIAKGTAARCALRHLKIHKR